MDAVGNVKRTVARLGRSASRLQRWRWRIRRVERNAQNLVTRRVDARGNPTLFSSSARGNLLTMTDTVISASSTGDIFGQITEPGEVDAFTFEAIAGQSLFYDAMVLLGTPALPVQIIRRAASELRPRQFLSDIDRLLKSLPETGVYRLKVRNSLDGRISLSVCLILPTNQPSPWARRSRDRSKRTC